MYKDCIFFELSNRSLYIDRQHPSYLEGKVSAPVWTTFCDKIDECFDPIIALHRQECHVRSLILVICFGGWLTLSTLWAVSRLFEMELWAFGLASLGLLVAPFGITYLFVRAEARQLCRAWPARIQNVCQEVNGWIPGTSFNFIHSDRIYYLSYIQVVLGEYADSDQDSSILSDDRIAKLVDTFVDHEMQKGPKDEIPDERRSPSTPPVDIKPDTPNMQIQAEATDTNSPNLSPDILTPRNTNEVISISNNSNPNTPETQNPNDTGGDDGSDSRNSKPSTPKMRNTDDKAGVNNMDSSDLPMPPFSTSEELETNSISVSLSKQMRRVEKELSSLALMKGELTRSEYRQRKLAILQNLALWRRSQQKHDVIQT